jgi:hypothetical protein
MTNPSEFPNLEDLSAAELSSLSVSLLKSLAQLEGMTASLSAFPVSGLWSLGDRALNRSPVVQ